MLRPADDIKVHHVFPPIPARQYDWAAYWDNDEPDDEGHMLIGYGRTPLDAIIDLLDVTEDSADWAEQ